MPRRQDLTGQRYGRLLITRAAPSHRTRGGQLKSRWFATCDCGAETVVQAGLLRQGRVTSCGCYQSELRVAQGKANRVAVPSYDALHRRISRERGAARLHACVDCGLAAAGWSYDYLDPAELIGRVHNSLVPYSLDVWRHYQPRCIPCHRRFDSQHRRQERGVA